MDERREEAEELAALDRENEDEQRMDAFIAMLTPVRELSLPMADYE